MSMVECGVNDYGVFIDHSMLMLMARHMSFVYKDSSLVSPDLMEEFNDEDFFEKLLFGYLSEYKIDQDLLYEELVNKNLARGVTLYTNFTGEINTLPELTDPRYPSDPQNGSVFEAADPLSKEVENEQFIFVALDRQPQLVGEAYHTVDDIVCECVDKLGWLMDDINECGIDFASRICAINGTVLG